MAAPRVLILNGSWNEEGSTACLIRKFVEGMKEEITFKEHHVNVPRMKPNSCLGCLQCTKREGIYCVQNDETYELVKEIADSDVVVFAFPVYYYNIPGALKILLDRLLPFFDWNTGSLKEKLAFQFKNKRFVCIVNCGGDEISQCENAASPLKKVAEQYHLFYDEIFIAGCDGDSVVAKDAEKQQKALEFGKKVGKEEKQITNK